LWISKGEESWLTLLIFPLVFKPAGFSGYLCLGAPPRTPVDLFAVDASCGFVKGQHTESCFKPITNG